MLPRRKVRRAWVVVATLLAAAAVACSSSQPDPDDALPSPASEPSTPPPAGASLAVVLPPAADLGDPEARDVDRQLQALDTDAGPDVTEVRSLRADADAFIPDLAALMADRDHDLVCVIGHGARAVVSAQADLHPEGRYCAAPSRTDVEPSPSVTLVELRFIELGHLVGVAAATAADGGAVGVVLDARRTGASDLRTGLLAGLGSTDVVEVAITDELTAVDAVDAVADAGVAVIVVDAAAAAATIEAVSSLAGRVPVLSTAALLGDEVATAVLSWRVRWDLVLRPLVDALVEDRLGGITSVGLADDVFEVGLGDRARPAVHERVGLVRDELIDGVRDAAVPAIEDPVTAPPAPRDPAPDVPAPDVPAPDVPAPDDPAPDDADDADDADADPADDPADDQDR